MRINHNISSMIAQGTLGRVGGELAKSLESLSTGLRIKRASDDAAGLSVSEQLRTQVRGIGMAKRNASDGIAMLQIAEGGLNEYSSILQRMRELAVQGTNDTLTGTERGYLDQEFQALDLEITRISDATQYNGQGLLDGLGFNGAGLGTLHIGPNANTADEVSFTLNDLDSTAIGVNALEVTSQVLSSAAITGIDNAINTINSERSGIGAIVNRLDHAINNLNNQEHNLQFAESEIRDVDFSTETAKFTRNQIMMQSATSMLAQANMVPQNVLSLLG